MASLYSGWASEVMIGSEFGKAWNALAKEFGSYPNLECVFLFVAENNGQKQLRLVKNVGQYVGAVFGDVGDLLKSSCALRQIQPSCSGAGNFGSVVVRLSVRQFVWLLHPNTTHAKYF